MGNCLTIFSSSKISQLAPDEGVGLVEGGVEGVVEGVEGVVEGVEEWGLESSSSYSDGEFIATPPGEEQEGGGMGLTSQTLQQHLQSTLLQEEGVETGDFLMGYLMELSQKRSRQELEQAERKQRAKALALRLGVVRILHDRVEGVNGAYLEEQERLEWLLEG